MKMKGEPATDDDKVAKAAASAWIGNTVNHKDKQTNDPANSEPKVIIQSYVPLHRVSAKITKTHSKLRE